jgi:hypothetical protein
MSETKWKAAKDSRLENTGGMPLCERRLVALQSRRRAARFDKVSATAFRRVTTDGLSSHLNNIQCQAPLGVILLVSILFFSEAYSVKENGTVTTSGIGGRTSLYFHVDISWITSLANNSFLQNNLSA